MNDLHALIREIGVARFIGRINGGIIDPSIGYEVVEQYVREQDEGFLDWFLSLFKRDHGRRN